MLAASIGQQKAQFFSTTTPDRPHMVQKMLQKLNKLCNKVLLHLSYSPELWPTDHHWKSPKFFAENSLSQPAGGRKCFPRTCQILIHGFLCYRINKYISHWQKCVDCNVLVNKDVPEPTYNDLKFTVQNNNYVWTNLIYA